MIKLVVFDLDGTLVDAFHAVTRSVNHVLTTLGFPKQSHLAIKRSVGWGEGELLAKFVGKENQARALKIYRKHHKQALVEEGGVRFLSGVKRTLTQLKDQGYTLAICSNRPLMYTKIILRALGIDKWFKVILCADMVDFAKPHPDMLCCIINQLDYKLSETVFVGDMMVDAEAGQRAYVKTVCVTTGTCSAKELKPYKPYKIIPKMSDLLKILEKLA